MKSLRTDDIIGAMPRVRHMPKNLYRQNQSYPYRHSLEDSPIKDYESYYKNISSKLDHSYNENIYGNFPLSQYDPNPFLNDHNANRSRYDGINSGRERQQNYRESQYQGIYDRQRELKIDERNSSYNANIQDQLIKPKQAMFISYDQVRQFQNISKDQKMYHQRKSSQFFSPKISQLPYKIESSQHQNPQKVDNQMNRQNSKTQNSNNNIKSSIELNKRSSSSHHNDSSQSLRNSKSIDKKEKNIFRGLGFNIITNSKYLYNVESSMPYVKKEV